MFTAECAWAADSTTTAVKLHEYAAVNFGQFEIDPTPNL